MAVDVYKTQVHLSGIAAYQIFCPVLININGTINTLITTEADSAKLSIKQGNIIAICTADLALCIVKNNPDIILLSVIRNINVVIIDPIFYVRFQVLDIIIS